MARSGYRSLQLFDDVGGRVSSEAEDLLAQLGTDSAVEHPTLGLAGNDGRIARLNRKAVSGYELRPPCIENGRGEYAG